MRAGLGRCVWALLLATGLSACTAEPDQPLPSASTAKPPLTVAGTVRSGLTQSGLRARIAGAVKAETNARGHFSVKVPTGSSTLIVSAPGYHSLRVKASKVSGVVTLHADPATTVRQNVEWHSLQRYERLWRLVHPDAHHYLTKEAFIRDSRLEDQRGYSYVSVTIKDVRFVTWTFPKCEAAAFGPKTYLHTAAVRAVIHQTRPEGGLEDVPTIQHLVRSGGLWRIFPTAGCSYVPGS
jgi:hypothetical protein